MSPLPPPSRRYDGKQRCSRLKAAFEDSSLKCLVLDAYWWARDAQAPCTACACLPSDIAAAWDTQREWAAAPHAHGNAASRGGWAGLLPGQYARSVAHYAHLLRDRCWACTPTAAATGGGAALLAPPGAP